VPTLEQIKKTYASYFTPRSQSTSRITPELIQTILTLNKDKKIGSNLIAEVLSEPPYNVKFHQSVISRILKTGRDNNFIKFIPRREMKTAVDQRIYQSPEDRKIHHTVREVTETDLTTTQKNKKGRLLRAPSWAKYKVVYTTPPSKTSKTNIPEKFQGVQYYKTKEAADAALKERLTTSFKPIGDPEASVIKRSRTRAENVKEVTKLSSEADKANIKAIQGGIAEINKYFKNKPNLINTTPFGKNVKAMMALRLDKDTHKFYTRLKPNTYYLEKAKQGQLFDLFDINPVAGKKPGGRFATNVNITPGQFNRAFVGAQLTNFFKKGVNTETAGELDKILKKRNIRVDLPTIGKIGAPGGDVAFDTKTGSFPRIIKTLKTMEAPPHIINLFTNQVKKTLVSKATNNTDNVCEVVFGIKGKAKGGTVGGGCARQMELAFDEAPEQTLNKISQSKSPKLKSFAQRALSIFPKLGTPGKIAAGAVAGAAAIGALTYNKELGEFVNPLNDDKASQATLTEWIKDNPVKTVAGTSIGFSTQEIPGAYKKARDLGRGRVRSALGITGALKPVLTTFGTPAMTALFEAPFAAKRLEEGETMTEVLTDPLGPTLGLSLMETLSQKAGVVRDAPKRTMAEGLKNYFNLSNVGTARPGMTSKILRMGMSPRVIAGASRFLGLPGLALSLGLTGYGAYKNYQNEEGMLYNLFNKNE